ncbi:PhoX family protein [Siccirubricoccus phaeus]|uniref:PhoX family protein n=1 Tax=Siccirubricoccus phaeus TaxID=2595053 RepID=UPI00165CDE31|nr:alkaline phosphatase PhoX [Siccirubricoccus phaeus]
MIPRRAALAAPLAAALAAPAPARAQPRQAPRQGPRQAPLGPLPLPVKQDDSIAPGWQRDLLIRWGDRVAFDSAAWNPAAEDAEGAAGQFGWDARILALATPRLPATDGAPRAVLAVGHPHVDPAMAFPSGRDRPALAAALQGASLLNLERQGGRWVLVDGGFQSRRLGLATLCRLGQGSVRGLLGVGGGCVTPWGTLLLAEGDPGLWTRRIPGLDAAGYGFVAEMDPFDPQSLPAKRAALGRFPHGDVAATLAQDGRAVVYQTDRREGGYLFRFVSAGPATTEGALESGTLFVCRMQGESVSWIPLPPGAEPLGAAAAAGGTGFDTPCGLGLDPGKPRLLLACQGSPARPFGHVIELTAAGGDDAAPGATAALLFAAGPPGSSAARYGGPGLPPGSAWPVNPDTVTVDSHGRAWVGTDRGGRDTEQADALFGVALDGPGRGVPLPLYGAPRGAGVGGAAVSPEGGTIFIGVRHPGAGPGARFARPGTRWPDFQPDVPPRSAVVGVRG